MPNSIETIEKSTRETAPKAFQKNKWGEAHAQAMVNPRPGFERALVRMITGLAEYADEHAKRYESPVGEDGFIGDLWEDIAKGIVGLFNGEHGRLDAGTIDGLLRAIVTENGLNGDEL